MIKHPERKARARKWLGQLIALVLVIPPAKADVGDMCFLLGDWSTPNAGAINFSGYEDDLTLLPDLNGDRG